MHPLAMITEQDEELTRDTLRAVNSMRIKFPGKTDEEAEKLLYNVSTKRIVENVYCSFFHLYSSS